MTNTKYYKSVNIRKEDWKTLELLKKSKNKSYTCLIKYAIASYVKSEESKSSFSFSTTERISVIKND